VIKRARWETTAKTCADLLRSLSTMPTASDKVIHRLERAQLEDQTPDHPWA
jgi:hypothetical protein